MIGKSVLLIEPQAERQAQIVKVLDKLKAKTTLAANGDKALSLIESSEFDLIFCSQQISGHSPKELCEYVHEFGPGSLPFVLIVEEQETDKEKARQHVGAEVVFSLPLDEQNVRTVTGLLFENSASLARLNHLEEENAQLRVSMRELLHPNPEIRLHRFDMFKQVIAMEIKKARRYGHPVSLLLLALDNYQELSGWLSAKQRSTLFSLLHRAVVRDIRDIDIPVLFAESKILVAMPHTPLEGSAIVADRIREHVSLIKAPPSLTQLSISVSLAVASTEGQEELSFGKIVQKAMRGLKEADIKGGNLVIVCKSDADKASNAEAEPGGKLGPRTFFV
ncbi:MAG: diguanylate cyclase [Deltaproteobacteria bacterium]|nr:diguanylate cyclase [Deltaproteobacteria bacterium]MBW1872997.1 diguanylate cyclase [Deltaproteobacteria bacterium]